MEISKVSNEPILVEQKIIGSEEIEAGLFNELFSFMIQNITLQNNAIENVEVQNNASTGLMNDIVNLKEYQSNFQELITGIKCDSNFQQFISDVCSKTNDFEFNDVLNQLKQSNLPLNEFDENLRMVDANIAKLDDTSIKSNDNQIKLDEFKMVDDSITKDIISKIKNDSIDNTVKESIVLKETKMYEEKEIEISQESSNDPVVNGGLSNIQLNSNAKTINEINESNVNDQYIAVKNENDIKEVVVTKFNSLRLPEFTEVKVKLKPIELGEITLKLVLEKGEIRGSILTERSDIARIISNQVTEIKEQLKENNINLNYLSVNVSQDESSGRRGFDGFNQGKNKGQNNYQFNEVESEKTEESDGFNILA